MAGCLADEHISTLLVQALRQAGVDVVTAAEIGLTAEDDSQLASLALAHERLVFTRDADFLRLLAAANDSGERFAPVVYWPQGAERSVSRLIQRIVSVAVQPEYEALCGQVYFV